MTDADRELRSALERMRDYVGVLTGYAFRNMPDFVLRRGAVFNPAPLPEDVLWRPATFCYANASNLARTSNGRFSYAEGYALKGGRPVLHAWCVDAAGNVVDPTWSDPRTGGIGQAYLGVVFPLWLPDGCRRHIPVLDDWQHRWPVLQGE